VERPEQYPWSSDRFYRRGKGPDWLDLERVLSMLGRRRKAAALAYRRLMGEPLEEPYEHLREIGQAVKGDEDFAIRAFRQAGEKPARRMGLTERQVAEVVAHALGFEVSQLQTSSRRRDVATARTLAAYLARREAKIAVARMAKFFDREESTLNRNVVRLEAEIASNRQAARQVEQLGKRLDNNTGTHG
jgi:hypothetical protein